MKLDPHGVKHAEVSSTVKRFIEECWDSDEHHDIITGPSVEMRRLVIAELNFYGLGRLEVPGVVTFYF